MTKRKCPEHHYILGAPSAQIDAKCRKCGKKRTFKPEPVFEYGRGRIKGSLPPGFKEGLRQAEVVAGALRHGF